MENKFVKAWDINKKSLKEYFKNTKVEEFDSYESLVKLVLEYVINPEMENTYETEFDVEKITCIDNGHYQGTQIYIIPEKTYQPSVDEYIMTSVGYGSCSGCDSLSSIVDFKDDELLNEEGLNDIMNLCLHLIQNMKWLDK